VRADDDASDASATLVAKCRIRQRAWYIKSPWVLGHAEAKCWPYRELFGAVGMWMWCAATELGQGERLMRGESSRLPGKCGCRSSGVALMGSRPRSVNTKRLGIRLMKCILKRWMRLSVFKELENLL